MKENLTKKTIKNSLYSFSAGIIAKLGGLALTILLARMLLPELFGIYGLVLSIVLIVFTLTDLGINSAFRRYISHYLGKKDIKKARSYLRYLLKIRSILILAAIIIMLAIARFLAFNIYDKPIIFLPLLFATLYISVNSFRSFFESLYFPTKDLKRYPLTTGILHGLRFVLALITILLISREFVISGIFVAFALASFISIFAVLVSLGKSRRKIIFGKTTKIQNPNIKKHIGYMSIASISLVIFGSVDTLMLGKFVDAEYLGFYRAAFGIVVSLVAIFSIRDLFLPVFTQIEKQRLERAFQKAFRYITLISIPAAFGLILIGNYLIKVAYGSTYSPASLPLYALSFSIIINPIIKLYSSLFESKEKTRSIAIFTVTSLLVNIILNYILIKSLLSFGQDMAIVGAGLATVLSQTFYLLLMITNATSKFKLNLPVKNFVKPVFSVIIMSSVLLVYNSVVEINILTGVLEILLGIVVYFSAMSFMGGIKKEDWNLTKSIFKKN